MTLKDKLKILEKTLKKRAFYYKRFKREELRYLELEKEIKELPDFDSHEFNKSISKVNDYFRSLK